MTTERGFRALSSRERAGALAPVAERFAHEWLPCAAQGNCRSDVKLRALYQALERFCAREQVSAADEHSFVEGAGALLGVILIEHFDNARHREKDGKHRVQLGPYGYFDPFSAIDAALESDDPRTALVRELSLAEAERRNEGPVSRVVASFSSQLERTLPAFRIVDHFEADVSLAGPLGHDTVEVDLRRAVETTRDQGVPAVNQVVSRVISMLPGASSTGPDLEQIRERIVPRLCRAETLRELATQAQTVLWSAPLVGELLLTLQVEHDGRARYVREREVQRWGLTNHEVRSLAIDNLAQRSQRFRLVRTDTDHGPVYVARTGDGRDSARLLLPSLIERLRAQLGCAPCVGIPHRDTFVACAAGRPELVRELARRLAHDAARAPHRLSERLFQLAQHGLAELPN